jgi:hypothetical protein
MKTVEMPATENPKWGFYGTCSRDIPGREADLWQWAMRRVSRVSGCRAKKAQQYLDSEIGRYLADRLCDRINHGMTPDQAADDMSASWFKP